MLSMDADSYTHAVRHLKTPISFKAWLLALVLLPSLTLTGFFAYTATQYAQERERQLTTQLADQTEDLARTAQLRLEQAASRLSTLALSREILANDIPAFYELAKRVDAATPNLSGITLIDRRDQLLFLTLRPLGTQLPVSQIDSVHAVFETGQAVLSKPFKAPISERMVVALNVPVQRNGQTVYCLRGILGLDTLAQLVQPEELPAQWIAGIFDQDGITVARSRAPDRYVGLPAAPALLKVLASKSRDTVPGMTREGIETLVTARPIAGWGWSVAVAVPAEIVTAPLRLELRRLTVVVLIMAAGLTWMVFWLSRHITRGLGSVLADARGAITGGAESTETTGIRELDELRHSLSNAELYRQTIVNQVQQRTADLNAAKQRLIDFAQQQEDSMENERLRIGREVHDQIGAIFTGVSMLVSGLPATAMPEVQRKMLNEALQQGVSTSRRITAELRPPLLDDLGLQIAVQDLAYSVLQAAQIECHVELTDAERLSPRQTIGCYRIVQEALTNVLRHAQASHCEITGRCSLDGTSYQLAIADNGQGVPQVQNRSGHYGLPGMHERARLMGGHLQIDSAPGRGFTLFITLPLTTETPPHD